MIVQIPELAEELKISTRQVRRMIDAGTIPFYKVGKRAIRLDLDEVKAAIRLHRRPAVDKNSLVSEPTRDIPEGAGRCLTPTKS